MAGIALLLSAICMNATCTDNMTTPINDGPQSYNANGYHATSVNMDNQQMVFDKSMRGFVFIHDNYWLHLGSLECAIKVSGIKSIDPVERHIRDIRDLFQFQFQATFAIVEPNDLTNRILSFYFYLQMELWRFSDAS